MCEMKLYIAGTQGEQKELKQFNSTRVQCIGMLCVRYIHSRSTRTEKVSELNDFLNINIWSTKFWCNGGNISI